MRIIQANENQLEALVPLFEGYRSFYKQDPSPEKSHLFLRDRMQAKESVIFIAYDGKEAIGFTQLYFTFSSVSLAPFYILNDLFVARVHRGKNVGVALLEKAQSYCTSEGFKGLALETAHDNPAQHLYEKLGWKKQSNLFYFWSAPEGSSSN